MSSPTEQPERPPRGDRFSDWPAPARYVVQGIVLLLLLAVIAAIAGVVVVRRPLPQTSGTLRLPGLDRRVSVYRDAHGVPQIWASTSEDLFRAQGFVEAQDRFWQMDERRHAASGRLAELLGERAVPQDLVARTMGFRAVAQQELDGLSDDTQRALTAFSEGVNGWLDQHSGGDASLEYTVLSLSTDYHPADWTPVDSLTWFKQLAWQHSGGVSQEMTGADLEVGRTSSDTDDLDPGYDAGDHPPIVPSSQASIPGAGVGADTPGGNAWVVSGRLTTTGQPLLAADPHLDTSLPGELYQVGLHCRTVSASCPYDVSGLTYAGVPGVFSGHDAKVAWALSDLHADDTDLYLEKVSGGSALVGDQEQPLTTHDEQIRVAGGRTRTITVRSSRHGPLLSDVSARLSSTGANAAVPDGSPDRGSGYAVAVSWPGLTPSRSFDAILALDRAQDWTDLQAAAALLTSPASGIVYADTAGHIGYQATGAIPVRPAGVTGRLPVPGWLPADDPTGQFVAYADLPTSLDPASGIIVAADQAPSTGSASSSGWDEGYRSARILRLLRTGMQEGARMRLADMSRIQGDTRNPMAPILVPYLLDVPLHSSYQASGRRLLASWDYAEPPGSSAAAYTNAVWRNLLALTFHDQLRRSLWPDGSTRWIAVMADLLQHPDDPWWDDADTTKVEHRDDILERAMRAARTELVRGQAREPGQWTWGHFHRLRLASPLVGGLGGLLLDRDGGGAAGGVGSVAQTSWDASLDTGDQSDVYDVTTAPAARMVVDLGHLDRSRWVVATGASGHAFDGSYLDQAGLLADGRTIGWPASLASVRRQAADVLTLR
ncbi:penicillin acylase family protein [Nocardioides mangrovicus]|uniref:Penicillin acylase family protein n=1 Tax=Nocardioides mangrovicus TaxID=2478913 RepID=A0A3L8NVW4_9ACTN|nr:penicillin acylase family protein [Nocardioides mangrovicus]RLV47476.1 penicillin acylase family protein [Nocardioides mangrovicus]